MIAEGPVRVGVLVWSQCTGWQALMRAAHRADKLGYDAIWAWDHLVSIKGDARGSIHEAFMTLAGWAATTRGARLGVMVAANTFRNPALVVKMITALDHMSAGRAVLGLGAAWFEPEHRAFGFEFGASAGERLDRLDEAAALVRALLDGGTASARGPHYSAQGVTNRPRPLQSHLPLLIGGNGERKTLATVARYADAWNFGGDIALARHKDQVLREWCHRVGRDEREIERTAGVGPIVIRDTTADARRTGARIGAHNGGWDEPMLAGPSDMIVEHLAPFVELGFRTLHFDLPAPFDQETLERFVGEVKPALQALAGPSAGRVGPVDLPRPVAVGVGGRSERPGRREA
jgi:alkanesulfonate monooxygenase SsuD/methylene tetrahydromethanopterin reductase-like flavin-dependent oxidoreductase (luciferase family)